MHSYLLLKHTTKLDQHVCLEKFHFIYYTLSL